MVHGARCTVREHAEAKHGAWLLRGDIRVRLLNILLLAKWSITILELSLDKEMRSVLGQERVIV